MRAIGAVAAGGVIFGAVLAARMAAFFRGGPGRIAPTFAKLSQWEHEVLDLIAAAESNIAIATRLALTEGTIATTSRPS